MAHALLSPSAASRWLTCTPSARLEAKEPNKTSTFADEGTLAHELGELLIKEKLGMILQKDYKKKLKEIELNDLFNEAMYTHCQDYAAFVIEEYNASKAVTPDAKIFLETKADLSELVPKGYGTIDIQIIADIRLKVVDLKYGKGVPVSAIENKQLMLYAWGAFKGVSEFYDIQEIEMIIYQPRLDSITRFIMPVADLLRWAEEVVRPKAIMATEGTGDLVAGEHCRFCKIRAKCRANYDLQMEITKHDFKDSFLLTPDEVADVVLRSNAFENWITAVKEYALDLAVKGEATWPGLKVVEGKSNRKYSDETAVVKLLTEKGKTEDELYTKKVIGITALQKLLGSSDFNTYVGPLLVKPAGQPTLVPEADKRPVYNAETATQHNFRDLTNE